ncbi:nuclease SbcCD subunit C-like [Helicoverpa zea]|uniref:nuclease SbcCD subunit C-like n=1 Tax=Helicoverpa zea TaxID=7113 RepID=UPI001F564E87|nr:nuclease SbcCD subunit C-like [Helicoverpa zea]
MADSGEELFRNCVVDFDRVSTLLEEVIKGKMANSESDTPTDGSVPSPAQKRFIGLLPYVYSAQSDPHSSAEYSISVPGTAKPSAPKKRPMKRDRETSDGNTEKGQNMNRNMDEDEVKQKRLSLDIERKIWDVTHRIFLMGRDIKKLKDLLDKDIKIGECYNSVLDAALKDFKVLKNRLQSMQQKQSQKEIELRNKINEMLRIESETKVAVDNSIEAMKKEYLNKETEISAAIGKMKDEEAQTKIKIERDINSLKQKLLTVKRDFDNNINTMLKNERKEKDNLQSKIDKIEQLYAGLKGASDKRINDMQNKLTLKEEKSNAEIKTMQRNETDKIREIKNKIKQIDSKEAKLTMYIENNMKRKENELVEKEKDYKIFAKIMLTHEAEEIREIEDKIKQIDSKAAKLKVDIENKIKHKQNELAAKEALLNSKQNNRARRPEEHNEARSSGVAWRSQGCKCPGGHVLGGGKIPYLPTAIIINNKRLKSAEVSSPFSRSCVGTCCPLVAKSCNCSRRRASGGNRRRIDGSGRHFNFKDQRQPSSAGDGCSYLCRWEHAARV